MQIFTVPEGATIEIKPWILVLQGPEKKPHLFDLKDAAEYLGMTTRKLKDLCRDKRITHSRPDYRTYRFTREDLDKWLADYRMHSW
jgi:excisionase family DNA binding protein